MEPVLNSQLNQRLSTQFFTRPTLAVARDLLGCRLFTRLGTETTGGTIVEVEAYHAAGDEASHSFRGPTLRNQSMFLEGGHSYVYLIYGLHHCFNVVTEEPGTGAAVLVRAILPTVGIETMHKRAGEISRAGRLGEARLLAHLGSGPARVCRALGIDRRCDGLDLVGSDRVWLEPPERSLELAVATGPRVGITRSTDLPWRFCVKDHPLVSRPRIATLG